MAWGNRPCFCGDSLLCRIGLPVSGIDFGTGRDMNLHCGATRPLCRERCVQRSLPCVGNSDRRTTYRLRPRAKYDRSLKFFLQKRKYRQHIKSTVTVRNSWTNLTLMKNSETENARFLSLRSMRSRAHSLYPERMRSWRSVTVS